MKAGEKQGLLGTTVVKRARRDGRSRAEPLCQKIEVGRLRRLFFPAQVSGAVVLFG